MKFAALFGLALAFASPAHAAPSFHVDVIGKGKPVILIPGLACTGAVWNATVAGLKEKYECHVLTLPGFGKQPPIDGPYLPRVRDEIIAYVKEKRLDHPAVIGHSLGGFMCFYLGVAEPKLFGPMISVDGLPFLGAVYSPTATAESMKPQAETMAKVMGTAAPEAFRASLKGTLKTQVTAENDIDSVFATSQYTTPSNAGQAIKEMLTTDLRSEVGKVTNPILLIAAGQWAKTEDQKKALTGMYTAQVAKAPNARLVVSWKSKHFIQLDDPDFFMEQTRKFLAENMGK